MIDTWTKHFQMHFHDKTCLYFYCNFIEICSRGPNSQQITTDGGNGMVPIIQKASEIDLKDMGIPGHNDMQQTILC